MSGKKIAVFVFAVIFAFTGFISGCENKPAENTSETNSSADFTSFEDKDADSPNRLPDRDYKGYEFRTVISENMYDLTLYADIEEETGDTVNDAIYQRNRLIEGRYNIKFKQIGISDYLALPGTFNKAVMSGSDDFDLCMQISREAWSIALTGTITPVNKLPYLDISQPWYSHDVSHPTAKAGGL